MIKSYLLSRLSHRHAGEEEQSYKVAIPRFEITVVRVSLHQQTRQVTLLITNGDFKRFSSLLLSTNTMRAIGVVIYSRYMPLEMTESNVTGIQSPERRVSAVCNDCDGDPWRKSLSEVRMWWKAFSLIECVHSKTNMHPDFIGFFVSSFCSHQILMSWGRAWLLQGPVIFAIILFLRLLKPIRRKQMHKMRWRRIKARADQWKN